MTTPTAKNKAAMVDPMTPRTKPPGAATNDQTTITEATNKVVTVDPMTTTDAPNKAATVDLMTVPTTTNKAAMVNPTKRTKPPRAVTDDQMTPMGATEVVVINPTTNRTKPPRAAMDDRTATITVVRRILTDAPPPVKADQMITLTEAARKPMADLTITTRPVPMANRRNAVVVRGYDRGVCNIY